MSVRRPRLLKHSTHPPLRDVYLRPRIPDYVRGNPANVAYRPASKPVMGRTCSLEAEQPVYLDHEAAIPQFGPAIGQGWVGVTVLGVHHE